MEEFLRFSIQSSWSQNFGKFFPCHIKIGSSSVVGYGSALVWALVFRWWWLVVKCIISGCRGEQVNILPGEGGALPRIGGRHPLQGPGRLKELLFFAMNHMLRRTPTIYWRTLTDIYGSRNNIVLGNYWTSEHILIKANRGLVMFQSNISHTNLVLIIPFV